MIKEYRKDKLKAGPSDVKKDLMDEEWVDKARLAEDMREEHGMKIKGNVMDGNLFCFPSIKYFQSLT